MNSFKKMSIIEKALKNKFMKFYNNVFAVSYKYYERINKYPRIGAAAVVFLHMFLLFILLIAVTEAIINYHMLFNYGKYSLIEISLAVILLILMIPFWKYYSQERADIIIDKFDKKTSLEKRMWGYITLLSLILEVTILAFVLNG